MVWSRHTHPWPSPSIHATSSRIEMSTCVIVWQQMCLPAEPPEMTAVGAPAGQTKQVGHQHGLFRLVGERKSCWRLADGS